MFNETHLSAHLWYLSAIIYVLVLVQLILRKEGKIGLGLKKMFYGLIPDLLAGDLVLGKYSIVLFQREISYIFARNWLFVGLPYFLIGMWLKENEQRINMYISKTSIMFLILISLLSTLLEHGVLESCNMNAIRDHYISTTIFAIAVFLLFLNFADNTESLVSGIGRKHSTMVYILHPIIIQILGRLFQIFGLERVFFYTSPVVVFIGTVVVVMLLDIIKAKVMQRLE